MRLGPVLAVAVLVMLGTAGCGAETEAALMPDVTGDQLDAARASIKDAGFTDDVDVDGGGLLGVVVESNWQVCDQSPAAGEQITGTPRLTVDRSCDGETEEEPAPATESPAPEAEPTPSEPSVITAATDPSFAAILADTDYCSDAIATFASQHEGATIDFDGSVVAMNNHDGAATRYDILVAAGDFNESSQPGPAFQFNDVNTTFDLHWTNDSSTSTVGVGDNLHIVATVDGFDANHGCLFTIDPVETSFR
ncbi:DUF4839 domain-containing protein [Isoptericola sp. b441]|uniref:DUF4839 domain-containing protein n=1 Tax=Actinotalea lenta TaxID=3064654 RepID=A0ABT9D971_9CELL|nr:MULTISPECIES: DUF4839 domain-containing protein [unclassified Isoptericola]MDO8105851.1 DUF4839 domain-containing protein [Isoptericola sp. b441]MDO8122567.1 DUF4839 domain-containing protein [Isoptericola sp. b490]